MIGGGVFAHESFARCKLNDGEMVWANCRPPSLESRIFLTISERCILELVPIRHKINPVCRWKIRYKPDNIVSGQACFRDSEALLLDPVLCTKLND